MHSPGHVAATDEKAEEFWPHYLEVIRRVSRTRGFAIPTRVIQMPDRATVTSCRVAETVMKIAANLAAPDANRYDLKYGMGGLSHQALMINIELYGTQVIPRVRDFCTLQSRGS